MSTKIFYGSPTSNTVQWIKDNFQTQTKFIYNDGQTYLKKYGNISQGDIPNQDQLIACVVGKRIDNIDYLAFSYCSSMLEMTFEKFTSDFVSGNALTWGIGADGHQVVCYCVDGIVVVNEHGGSSSSGPTHQGQTYVTYVSGSGYSPVYVDVSGELNSSYIPNCSYIDELFVGSNVTSIGVYGFASYPLTNVVLPESVLFMADYAFNWCYSLRSVEIYNPNIMYTGYPFADCPALTEVWFHNSNADFVKTHALGMGIGSDGHEVVCYCTDGIVVINERGGSSSGKDESSSKQEKPEMQD